VDKIDRFSRHLGTLLVALDQLNSANVTFVSVQEHLDLTTPWGKLMLTVLGMLAEIYIDNLRQETRKGKVQRARDGLWNGSIPFGYCNGLCSRCTDPNGTGYCPEVGQPDKTNGKSLIPHPIDSLAVKLAFEWYVGGQCTDGMIAEKLNTYVHFLPDGSGVHFRTKGMPGRFEPGLLSKDLVRELLQRRFYTGQLVYRGVDERGQRRRRNNIAETFQGQHPVLVDVETFNKALDIRKTYTHSPRVQYGKAATVFPLSGILRCASCGAPMRGASTSGRRYYQDTTRIEHRGECEQLWVRADEIETQVADLLGRIRLPEDWPANAETWLGMDGAGNSQQAQLRWERAKELYLRGDINHEQYEVEMRLYESGANDLTSQIISATIALGDVIRNFAQEWARALPVEKRKLLRFALAAAFVRGNTLVAIQPTPALFPLMSRSLEESQSRCGDDGRRPRAPRHFAFSRCTRQSKIPQDESARKRLAGQPQRDGPAIYRNLLAHHLLERCQRSIVVRVASDLGHVLDVAHDASPIHHEHRPAGHPPLFDVSAVCIRESHGFVI
jgi:hypothetical protein